MGVLGEGKMKKYRVVDVSETKLEDLVRRAPELIEEGLRFLDHQVATDRGPLDVLLVDSARALVVVELKATEDDGVLVQGLDYYDYVMRSLDAFARVYQKHKIDTSQEARLLLIAPGFSDKTLNRVKWLNLPVSLFTYRCLEFEEVKGEVVPVYQEVTVPMLTDRPEARSVEDVLNYITDPTARSRAKKAISEIASWDERILVEARKRYINFVGASGHRFGALAPRRNCFLLGPRDEGWHKVTDEDDLATVMALLRTAYEKYEGT